jgi:hypothetical protein
MYKVQHTGSRTKDKTKKRPKSAWLPPQIFSETENGGPVRTVKKLKGNLEGKESCAKLYNVIVHI